MNGFMEWGLELARVAGSLALVILLMVGALMAVRRLGVWAKNPKADSWVEILSRHYLDPKHTLFVVKVQRQHLLLGISPQGLHMLTRLDDFTPGQDSNHAPSAPTP